MQRHSERRLLPFTQSQLYDLVADIEKYPLFLPWCAGARIRERHDNLVVADLMISFKVYRERFTSRVTLQHPDRIDTVFSEGPFKQLQNRWVFIPDPSGGCIVDFFVEFEFKSKILDKLISVLFNEAVHRMVKAFETRAHALYGAGVNVRAIQGRPIPG
jgi:coenzyme Q-binding protein COQ10